MANNKWTKWAIGLSSAALFVGFVGIINGQEAAGSSSQPAYAETYIAESGNNLGSGSGQTGQSDPNTGSSQNQKNIQRDTGRSPSSGSSTGRMRTHAS